MIDQVLLYVVYQQLIVMSIAKIIGKENGSVRSDPRGKLLQEIMKMICHQVMKVRVNLG